jgi:hypothetical protein
MSLEREMLPDSPEARHECLCAFVIPKTTHAALAFARKLMAVFSPVVVPGTGFDKDVLDLDQFGDFGLCRRIAAQLVVTILRGASGKAASTRLKNRLATALSRRFCSRISSSTPC